MEEDSENAGIWVVREMAHNFLLEVCCSRKYGISFHDASFGTAGRQVLRFYTLHERRTQRR